MLTQTFSEKLEFPFLPDEAEHLIISMTENRSILLVGRSGTGKTTIVVQRLWSHYRVHLERRLQQAGGDTTPTSAADADANTPQLHQLFVTANPILRNSVSKSFKALQSGYDIGGSVPQEAAADEDTLNSLSGLREHDWPLFLRAHNWLRLLDATLESPYFSAAERSVAASRTSGWHSEAGVMESLLDIDDDASDGDEEGEEGGEEEEEGGGRASARQRTEMTYDLFETVLWPHSIVPGGRT